MCCRRLADLASNGAGKRFIGFAADADVDDGHCVPPCLTRRQSADAGQHLTARPSRKLNCFVGMVRYCRIMDMLDPDLLRTFLAFVDGGSLARAATTVARSPSAVTAQMQRLEEIVGE